MGILATTNIFFFTNDIHSLVSVFYSTLFLLLAFDTSNDTL